MHCVTFPETTGTDEILLFSPHITESCYLSVSQSVKKKKKKKEEEVCFQIEQLANML